jgi:hypothetical protein
MEIEVSEKNRQILLDVLSESMSRIRKISISENKEQSDKKRLTLLDLLYRQFPVMNSISLLLEQYFDSGNYGNMLPIGLILRCSLEDMLFAKYLLTFKDNSIVFENEILVQSRNAIKQHLEYIVEKESDYWMCSDSEKEKIDLKNRRQYDDFKSDNPKFFNKSGKIKSINKLRNEIPNIQQYFNSNTINKQGPYFMFDRLKSVDFKFSYIYFQYKFYCLFEHYSFQTRRIMELNSFTFGHFAFSIEFILRAIIDILDYLNVDKTYKTEFISIKKSLGELLKN